MGQWPREGRPGGRRAGPSEPAAGLQSVGELPRALVALRPCPCWTSSCFPSRFPPQPSSSPARGRRGAGARCLLASVGTPVASARLWPRSPGFQLLARRFLPRPSSVTSAALSTPRRWGLSARCSLGARPIPPLPFFPHLSFRKLRIRLTRFSIKLDFATVLLNVCP